MTLQQWALAYRSIQSWFDPLFKATPMGFSKPILIISLAFIFSIIYFRFFPQREKKYETNFIILLIIYTISYTAFTIIARLLFDPYIPLDESRIQYPTYIGLFLLLIYGLYRIQSRIQNVGWFKPAVLVTLYIFGVWVFTRGYKNNSYNLIFIGHKAGLGLVRMTDENLLSTLMQYPLRDYRLYSDNIEKLYFLSKIYSYSITSNPNDEIEKILIIKKDYGVVVVLFDQQVNGPEYMSMIPGLHLIYKGIADVYVAP
jgi:hypothetical protein